MQHFSCWMIGTQFWFWSLDRDSLETKHIAEAVDLPKLDVTFATRMVLAFGKLARPKVLWAFHFYL